MNFAEHDETVDVTLELADDAADIFEVRGYPRDRGTLLPIAATDDRATFQYDGLDGHRTPDPRRLLGAGRARPGPTRTTSPNLGGAIRYRWALAARRRRSRTS